MEEKQDGRTRGRKLKTRPQEFFRMVQGVKYAGVVLLEFPKDVLAVSRRIRRELSLSVIAMKTDRARGLFPMYVVFIPESEITGRRDSILRIVEETAESYFDGSEPEKELEHLET